MTKQGEIKIIITSSKELPWEGYSKESPLFKKEAICLINGLSAIEPLIEEVKDGTRS
ncbi:hypothetical protein LCGC14_0417140 [marine sediment metagenome]|uniref:Uncharacterized protein n=1 Tax=marine sediment metagenome TaxID=412755 RepID=A0A0F9SSB3_9ZZZZ